MTLEPFAGVNAAIRPRALRALPAESRVGRSANTRGVRDLDAGARAHWPAGTADAGCGTSTPTSSSARPISSSRSAATAISPRSSIRSDPPIRRRPVAVAARHGITDDDLKRLPASLVGGPVAESSANAFDAIEKLRRIYCSTTGFDYRARVRARGARLAAHRAESGRFLPPMDAASVGALLDRITQVEVFERFLHRTFPGKTRFSIEGLDMLVPILDEIICGAADRGAPGTIIGMAHRGRLNVLAHVLQKPYSQILAEFKDPVPPMRWRIDLGWMGDVKYHAGARTSAPRGQMHVTMPPNPSHLEAVEPGGRRHGARGRHGRRANLAARGSTAPARCRF